MNKEVEIKIKLDDYIGIELPKYSHNGDACVDIKCAAIDTISEENTIIIHTGIHVELPENYVMLILPRSSNCKTPLYMPNSVGVIDSGYRGEILVKYKAPDRLTFINYKDYYKVGDRVAQAIVLPYPTIKFTQVDNLTESSRGNGGFGSTGK